MPPAGDLVPSMPGGSLSRAGRSRVGRRRRLSLRPAGQSLPHDRIGHRAILANGCAAMSDPPIRLRWETKQLQASRARPLDRTHLTAAIDSY